MAEHKWKGIYKVVEECGELIQVCGKLGPFPSGVHPDGAGDLRLRLQEELADVIAACMYMQEANGLDAKLMDARVVVKLDKFRYWGLSGIGQTNEEPVYGATP